MKLSQQQGIMLVPGAALFAFPPGLRRHRAAEAV